ncbi:hypothetical protein BGW38_007253 [Lunasporangiospora selenospora]|uniref:EF-hand domain-containing protein n=1 Tax=Lunasporangiospora selenospora TaxID=979761 RepID=A0A9P6KGL6_9FUNG|nr:hypothetical protein BGW38_007253 [Lunasporangiospora selenospora]
MDTDDAQRHQLVKSAFHALDHNKDGAINARDLLLVYADTFPSPEPGHAVLDEATANALISIASSYSNDGQDSPSISFQDFQQFLKIHRIDVIPTDEKWTQESLEALLKDLTQVKDRISNTLLQEEAARTAPVEMTTSPTMAVSETDREVVPKSAFSDVKRILASDTIKYLIAGGVAGAVSRTIVSPLERMKILFQVQGPEPANYQGVIPTLRKMWAEEGIVGFMRGNGTNVIRIVPYSAVQFASYEQFKKLLMEPGKHDLDTPRRLAAGAMAGLTSVAFTYPLDIVRTRLSIQSAQMANNKEALAQLPGIWQTMVTIYSKEGGIVGLYRGLGPTLTGVAPYVALNFQSYEVLRAYLTPPGETSPSVGMKLLGGAIAGSFAQTVTYPLDVLRRRMQVTQMDSVSYKYSSTWDGVKKIIKQEGVKGLYKGMVPNYLKVAPAISISFVVYEQCKQILIGKKTTAGM